MVWWIKESPANGKRIFIQFNSLPETYCLLYPPLSLWIKFSTDKKGRNSSLLCNERGYLLITRIRHNLSHFSGESACKLWFQSTPGITWYHCIQLPSIKVALKCQILHSNIICIRPLYSGHPGERMGNEPSISTFCLNIYSAYLFIPHQTTSHCAAVVTRVCCGSQDPTDCWPGKAGTGSRQQQLPAAFLSTFYSLKRRLSECSRIFHNHGEGPY